MHRKFIMTGAILGAVAVALGAFGAHGLKRIVAPDTVQVFQAGVQYQMYHAIALVLAGVIYERYTSKLISVAGKLFVLGIILFSGSLYVLTLGKASDLSALDRVGMITPVGGICFIAAWMCLFLGVIKKRML